MPPKPKRNGPFRVLRAIDAGAATATAVATKARIKQTTTHVYLYRHRKSGLVAGGSGELRLTRKGKARLRAST